LLMKACALQLIWISSTTRSLLKKWKLLPLLKWVKEW